MKNCLEGGTGTVPQTAKYLVYKLPEESALIGTECKFHRDLVPGFEAHLSCRCHLSGGVRQRLNCRPAQLLV